MEEPTIDAIEALFGQQMAEWGTACDNYAKLSQVKERELTVDGSRVVIQCNPERLRSSAAKVDKASIANRQCFLCKANRPVEQRVIEWGDYEIIVNPYPIFTKHFTIPTRKHTAQRIVSRIGDMMRLAMLMQGYTIFYNGPCCGASAPDHCHFQAGTKGTMPIEAEIACAAKSEVAREGTRGTLSEVKIGGRHCYVIESTDVDAGARLFEQLYATLPLIDGQEEPMMNVLCRAEEVGKLTVVVIPRRKHRPDCYYAEGDRQLLISPASVDLGGIVVCSRIEDYERITAEDIAAIFSEVCITDAEVAEISEKIKHKR
ncbi:MAG: DUF4922 domain-containing protein [Muribaculaceae bacterium]